MPSSKIVFFIALLTLLLCSSVQTRRAGRRSSGSSGRTCAQQCQNDPDLYTCIEQCNTDDAKVYTIIGSVLGSVLLLVIIIVCCACNASRKFNQIKGDYHTVNAGAMLLPQFIQKKNAILNLINASGQFLNFTEMSSNGQARTVFASATAVSEKDYLTEISLQGSDDFGKWQGEGSIVSRNQGYIFLYFNKEYLNKAEAGEIGKVNHIVYESSPISSISLNNGIEGRWHGILNCNKIYEGGSWGMRHPGNGAVNMNLGMGINNGMGMPMNKQNTLHSLVGEMAGNHPYIH